MFDTIVVGKGLIGSAAGRYLSETGQDVAIIGPDEPDDWPTHQGAFASHYDQGRITRILDAAWVWATLAKRSIAQYAAIEQQSGIKFHFGVGGLKVEQQPDPSDGYLAKTERVGRQLDVEFTTYTRDMLREAYPWLDFPRGAIGLLENSPAGYIQPRALVAAQLAIAKQQGASIIREIVAAVKRSRGDAVEVKTAQGQTYRAQKVLIAAGAYTNTLLEQKLALEPTARTILLAELPEQEVRRYRDMPTLIYELADHPTQTSVYLLPPIQYPDGKYYLKIGGDDTPVAYLHTFEALRDWFHTPGHQAHAEALKEILLSVIPQLKAKSFHTKPCVTTHTMSDYPYLDALEPGRIFVAAGGCGYAAKSSDEIGRLAAQLVEHDGWTDALDADLFSARLLNAE